MATNGAWRCAVLALLVALSAGAAHGRTLKQDPTTGDLSGSGWDGFPRWIRCITTPEWKCTCTKFQYAATLLEIEARSDPQRVGDSYRFHLSGTNLCLNIWGGNSGTLVNPYTCVGSADNELWSWAQSEFTTILTTAYTLNDGTTVTGGCLVCDANDNLTAITYNDTPPPQCQGWSWAASF